ncbi:hypothetical protein Krac_3750 [Ktedonobacter racemifer DSM 44963]|uniref:Uncharacterized protein n=1 Tax=Ktedonobacter racemifer DSM 44963 TaxID=485913 RepID=D6U2X1_KTERA|nr:hypothetical protein Krac_3750 [Ktedonobacter racemifer DSM 44963]
MPIPMFRTDFSRFTLKSVEVSASFYHFFPITQSAGEPKNPR